MTKLSLRTIARRIEESNNSYLARLFEGVQTPASLKSAAIAALREEKDPIKYSEISRLFGANGCSLWENIEYIRNIEITPWKYPGVEYNEIEVEIRPHPNNKPWGIQGYIWWATPHEHQWGDTFSLGWGEYTGHRYGRECSCGARIEWQDIEE